MVGCTAGLVALALTSAATAAPATTAPTPANGLEIEWSGPADCRASTQLAARIQALLASSSGGPASALTDVRIGVEYLGPVGGDLRILLRIAHSGSLETRELHGQSCASLVEASALIVALRLDTSAREPARELTPLTGVAASPGKPPLQQAKAPTQPAAQVVDADTQSKPEATTQLSVEQKPDLSEAVELPETARVARSSAPSTGASDRLRRFELAAGAGTKAGNFPGWGLDLLAEIAIGGPRWRIELGGRLRPPRTAATPQSLDVGIDVGGASGLLMACARVRRKRVELQPCLGLEVGLWWAAAVGAVQAPRTARSLWLAAELDLGFVWWLASRFGLRARTGGTLALARPAYHVGDRTVPTYSYTTGVLGFGATIALLVKIGRPL